MPSSVTCALGTPSEKQRAFFEARGRFVAYGGARGGGKSWAVRKKALLLAARHAGIRILLLRRTYPELRENHILPLLRELHGVARYKETEKAFIFPNGSRLKFGYMDGEGDALQYQGQEFDVIFMDEATQFTEFQFKTLTACLRGANDLPKRFYLTCNPGGVGHAWVKRLFITREYRALERAEDYVFIPARVYDNTALTRSDPGYVRMLESLPEDLRRAWLEGDWDIFAGQYFKEFRREVHVAQPFAIPEHWRRYVTMDYGLDMLACYFIALNGEGRAYVYREIYEPGLIVSDACERIRRAAAGERIEHYLAPPDLWNRRQETGRSVAELFAGRGVRLTRTSNARVDGWMAVHEWLRPFDADGKTTAALQIFENCPNLIRTLPALRFDGKNANDTADTPHELTHAPDALRGFCIFRARAAGAPPGPERRAQFAFERAEEKTPGKEKITVL